MSTECSQETRDLLDRLLAAHEAWFDVSRNYSFAGRMFPGYAEFHSTAEKYVLTKRAKLWEANAHEYLFFQTVPTLDARQLDDLVRFITTEGLAKVKLEPNHMTSYLSLVVLADAIDTDVAQRVRKTSFRKNYRLGLQGWADLRLAVVDVGTAKVFTNAQGKALKQALLTNLNTAEHATSSAMPTQSPEGAEE